MSEPQVLTGAQIRMAKAALGWSNTNLVDKTGLHRNTIHKAEKGEARESTYKHLRMAFEVAGIEFISEGAASMKGGAGVRLKK